MRRSIQLIGGAITLAAFALALAVVLLLSRAGEPGTPERPAATIQPPRTGAPPARGLAELEPPPPDLGAPPRAELRPDLEQSVVLEEMDATASAPARDDAPAEDSIGLTLLVREEHGPSIAGAQAWLWSQRDVALAGARSDPRGRAELRFAGAPPVEGFLGVEALGHAPHWEALRIPVREGSEHVVLLRRGRELEVVVLEAPAALLAGASVLVRWQRVGSADPRWSPWSARTSADGVALLPGIPERAGVLQLEVEAPGLVAQARSVLIDALGPLATQRFVLEPAGELVLWIEDEAGVRHAGRVAVQPQRGPRTMAEVRAHEPGRATGLPLGVALDVLAYVHGAGLAWDELVLDGREPQEHVVRIPELVPVRFVVRDAEGAPARGRVLLRATDGRTTISWAPRGVRANPMVRSFQTELEQEPPTVLWVERGAYSLSIHDEHHQRVEQSELTVRAGMDLVIDLPHAGPPR